MVKASDHPSLLDRIRSSAHVSKLGLSSNPSAPVLPVSEKQHRDDAAAAAQPPAASAGTGGGSTTANSVPDEASSKPPPPAPPPAAEDESGDADAAAASVESAQRPNVVVRFFLVVRDILCSSIFNVLLVFVPAGIAVEFLNVSPTIVFAINAIALIPLAGLLSHATESVASRLGDTVGALLNVTFGNAVELIIFIIALSKDEISIVQASLVGSILANLLLILGMCFLFGGLRFREQIYNISVTQMSACLLSLSVTSLLLPTAFHASFSSDNDAEASSAVVAISRGSSIILLLVYVLYLLFQLKSHAYMYESTPQHVIDEESQPGVLADMLNSSSSSDTSSSSSNLSDSSSGSRTTAKRIKRAFRRRPRKSSAGSKDAPSMFSTIQTPSEAAFSDAVHTPDPDGPRVHLGAIESGDEGDADDELRHRIQAFWNSKRKHNNKKSRSSSKSPELDTKGKSKRKGRGRSRKKRPEEPSESTAQAVEPADAPKEDTTPHVSFAPEEQFDNSAPKKPLLRSLTRPTIPKMLTTTVFSNANATRAFNAAEPTPAAVPRAPYGLRRTQSVPDRLNRNRSASAPRPEQNQVVSSEQANANVAEDESSHKQLSRTSAVLLLLVSTGLVAVCAEFLVSSINYLVSNTNVNPAFIGLIILPIVGNAAEHVTAVTVASKNKMDLAIGVAVGSSIQIALFVTPIIVILGWILDKDMSLYFTLFETVSLFASTFIVNFLVLDGRSNYLEGALLIAAYTIIAVAAFFYPDPSRQSSVGGAGSRHL